jgi:hypothetical protein
MKRLLFTFTLFLLTASVVLAQQKGASFAVEGEAVHDFGDIKEADGLVTHTFKIKNEGDAPLVITRVQASCGCTTPDWTKEPIAAGKTGEIKITYDPAGRPGPINRSASVYRNGHAGTFILQIKGNVIGKN